MAHAAGDAHEYPIYSGHFRVSFPILDADGDLVTGATGLDSEVSIDNGTFADCTNEATEIATSSGMYYLDLTGAEMTGKIITVIVKTTSSGAKTTPITLYPRRLPVLETDTAEAGAGSTITFAVATASAKNSFYNGCFVRITNNSPSGAQYQVRRILSYVGSTRVATVDSAWGTNPSSASTYDILTPEMAGVVAWAGVRPLDPATAGAAEVNARLWNNLTTVALPLAPTTAGRTLDVSAGGEAGIDLANVGSPTTVVNLSGTTIKTATDVETDTADIQTRIPAALGANGNMKADIRDLNASNQSLLDLKDLADTGYNPVTHYIAGIEGTLNQFDDLNNAVTAPTAAQNRAEMDTNSTKLADILTDTGTTLDGRIPAALTADGNMKSDALRVNGTAQTAGDIAALINALALYTTRIVARGTAAGASTTSVTTSAFTPAGIAADQFKGRIIIFDVDTATTALRGQATDITASTISATPTFTVTALTTAPAAGDTFTVV